jgi:hypothetical protein
MDRPSLTAALERAVAAYVRAGGFPHVAAEAAGVPRAVFDAWLRSGAGARAAGKYRRLVAAVRGAAAEARLGAEIAAHKDKPLDWLKSGPGKERLDAAGWSAAAKAQPGGDRPPPLLMQPEFVALIRGMVKALATYPEARVALADFIAGMRRTPST